jgi:DNA-binding transcriptional MerR regulator
MATYTVKQLARLSGVSVRTLHHYDEIGLLRPAFIGENRYRYYGREELLRLQDILFHRELGVPLQEIGKLLDTDGRDRLAILREHRERLAERVERSRQLLATIDRTIAQLKGDGQMDDKDLYKGFAPEKQEEYEAWLVDNYGDGMRDQIKRSKQAVAGMDEAQMREVMAEGEAAEKALAVHFLAGELPDSEAVEPALERHRAWVGRMWGRDCPPQAHAGLADLYLAHPDFRARYEAYGEGFTDWLVAAMKAGAARLAT